MKMHATYRFGMLHCWCRYAILAIFFASAIPAIGLAAEEPVIAIEMHRGDTLSSIAKRYLKNPNDWSSLQRFNNVRLDRAMPVGTRVNVPIAWMRIVDIEAQIIATRGTVRIERGSTTIAAAAGTMLKVGDRIRVGEGSSLTLKFPDESTSSLHANTDARLDMMRGVPSTDLIAQRIRLDAGRIESAVTPRKNASSEFEIQTPVATIGVRGTQFRTTVDDTSRGEVLEGRVDALGKGSPTPVVVNAGFATVIPASGIPSPPVTLLPAPDLTKNPTSFIIDQPAIIFDPIANAEFYRAMVAGDLGFTNVVTEITSKIPWLQLPSLPDGNYFLRVRGIDANRLEGRNGEFTFSVKTGNPPPPAPLGPTFNNTLSSGNNVVVSWAGENQAASYRLQIASDESFAQVLHRAERTITLRLSLPSLQPGRYYWRVASNRPDGASGPWSPVMQFVVGTEQPTASQAVTPATK